MFKLIRDKIPEAVKQDGKVCNYATAENNELFIALLRNKLIEEVNEFLSTGTVDELIDITLVVNTLLEASDVSKEQFDELYKNKLDTNGGFEKRYIGFFPDNPPASQPENKE